MFWKNWNWPSLILAGAGLAVVAIFFVFPLFARQRENEGHRYPCPSKLKQLGLGFLQYTQDYDEKFPLVSTGRSAYGWADALQPYLKSTHIYQCPLEQTPPQTNPRESGYTDFPFNALLTGKPLEKINDSALQILSLDGNDGEDLTDARYSLSQLSLSWQQDNTSPLHRHKGYANYLFADGHVKAISPQTIAQFGTTGYPTF